MEEGAMRPVECAGAQAAYDKSDEAQRAMVAVTLEVGQALPRIYECVLDQTLPVRAELASSLWAKVLTLAFLRLRFVSGPPFQAAETCLRPLEAGEKADFRDELRACFASLHRYTVHESPFKKSRPVRPRLVPAGDRFTHGSIGLNIFHSDIIHYPEIARAKSVCHSLRDERFGLDHFGSHFLGFRAHFLLDGYRRSAAHLGFRLRDALVCFGLFGLQFRTDIVADIHIGDVDGKNFKRCIAVQAFSQNGLGNAVGILQHFLVGMRRTDRAHDAFAHAGDNRFFSCATDESIEMRTHRHTRFDFHADSVLRDAINCRAAHGWVRGINHLWIDARAHRFQHGFAGALCR